MPKRIGNDRFNRSKGTTKPARYGRVRIGHWKRRMLDQMDELAEQDALGKLEEEAKAKYEDFKVKVKAIIPSKILRRHQGR